MTTDKETARHKAIERFILLIYLFDLQYPTFYKEIGGKFKQIFNNFTTHLHRVRDVYAGHKSPELRTYLDESSALAWEVLDELEKAQDKQLMLAVMKAVNAGEVKIAA